MKAVAKLQTLDSEVFQPRTLWLDYDTRRSPGADVHCCKCQKGIDPLAPHRWVYLTDDMHTVHPEDLPVRPVSESDYGWMRIGVDCAKKHGLEWSVDRPFGRVWQKVNNLRYVRCDGAVVRWDDRSPYPNPVNPRARMWTAWEPDPSIHYLCIARGRLRRSEDGNLGKPLFPRRWKTPESAMNVVDELFPVGGR